ncbi:MAG: cytidylyltransferase domain-containing protein [Proteocatella sp.]
MIYGKSILAIIPARGGSKGLPRKNILELKGKPLIAWTIEAAKKSTYIDTVVVSSEDNEIIEVALKWGAEIPFHRPQELAQDDTPSIDIILHAINILPQYDYILLLQPTSPLRTAEDIDSCIEYFFSMKATSCVSISQVKSSPYWMYSLEKNNKLKSLLGSESSVHYQRQKLPVIYEINGAIYIAEKKWLIKNKGYISNETIGYIMEENKSIDIDNESDFLLAQILMKSYSS